MQRWLSKHIAGLTLAAPLILVLFIVFSLIVSIKSFNNASLTGDSAKLALLSNAAISEIQKERGLSAGFIGSNGRQFQTALQSQRKRVDSAINSVKNSALFKSVPNSSKYLLAPLNKHSSELKMLRSNVDNIDISVNDTVKSYTLFTTALLEFNGRLVSTSKNALGKQKFVLLYKLAYLQENAGLERALLSNIFASATINDTQRGRFNSLVSSQNALVKDLVVLSTPEFGKFIESFSKGNAEQKINTYRSKVTDFRGEAFSTSADEWFSEATKRIEGLTELRNRLFDQLLVHADEESSAALGVVVLDLILLLLTFAIALASFLVLNLRKKQSSELQYKLKSISNKLDLSLTIERISEDDLGEVTLLLNQLISQFKEDLSLFQTAAHEISSASHQATVSSETTASNVRQQQHSISSSLLSIESINVGIDADLESTVQLNTYAHNSASLVKDGENRVSDAVSGIRVTASEVKKVGDTIEVLNLRVEDILKMVDVIRSVAEQTNLLALNAAIEAARAGEQGRGFAVVADEVRALAKRTQDSTEEISKVVDELNNSSNAAFTAIAVGAEKASDAVNLAEQISIVLTDVAENMIELEKLSENVNQSAQQQGFSLKQLADAMRDMDSGSNENSASAEQVAAAAHQLSAVASGMLDNVNKYKV